MPLEQRLQLLVLPLFRVGEASAGGGAPLPSAAADGEARELAEQVLAHLRGVFGAERVLLAYTAAREQVRSARTARKAAAARRALIDPEAVARLKLKRGRKKGEARARKAEERRRQRAARSSGGFGFKASGSGGKGKGKAGRGFGGVSQTGRK
jgi:U3 small nucleolar RNA-associated protein 20